MTEISLNPKQLAAIDSLMASCGYSHSYVEEDRFGLAVRVLEGPRGAVNPEWRTYLIDRRGGVFKHLNDASLEALCE